MKILNIVEVRGKLDQLWGWAKAGKSNVNYAMAIENVDSFTDNVISIFEKDVIILDKKSFSSKLDAALLPLNTGHYKHEDIQKVKSDILESLGL